MLVLLFDVGFLLGVDVFGWMKPLFLGAGCGVFGCMTVGAGTAWLALEGRLLERGRTCITSHKPVKSVRDDASG